MEVKEFEIDKDDYLKVIIAEGVTEVYFIHKNKHGLPILMGDMTVTLNEIVKACKDGTAKNCKRSIYWIRYVEYIDDPDEEDYIFKRVICIYPKIYKHWMDATNKATDLNDKDRMHKGWLEKFLSKFSKTKIGWIVSEVEWE